VDKRQGVFFILGGAVLWGTTGTAQALAPASAQPLAVGALRLVIGGITLLLVFLFARKRACPLPAYRLPIGPVLLAAACMAAYQVLFFAGVRKTGVAVGTIVGIGSSPVLAGLLGYLFRHERPGWKWGIATALAITGCTLLALTGKAVNVDPLGMLLAIGAGGAYATFSLISKGLLEKQPVEMVMAMVFCLGAVMLSPLLLTQDLTWLAQPIGMAAILWLGLFATALAYILFGKGLQRTPVATAVTLSLGEPLTAGLLGLIVLGERVTPLTGLGMLFIFSGLATLSIRPRSATESLPGV
jgi:drug/metabolite transporter, DME family